QAILQYLYKTYMPISAQWTHHFIHRYYNFSIHITSSIKANNNNIKSYLLNNISHLYWLIEAI
ncbi:hypothetical protein BGZ63DRAFT_367180, partial [Mariannaea sp. PMI_226]